MPPVDNSKSAGTATAEVKKPEDNKAAEKEAAAAAKAAEKEAAVQAAAARAAAKETAKVVTLTAAEAAKAVKREVPVIGEDGKPNGETKAVKVTEDEVLAWSLRGHLVTVVTTDGQKLVGEL